jgi:glycosyltransferase involved in cell wall biosynthesis
MRILYVVPNPPSLIRVRPYNLIRGLAARGHRVTVATVWGNEEERADVERLRGDGVAVIAAPVPKGQVLRNLLAAALAGLPLQALYARSPQLERMLAGEIAGRQAAAEAYDIVHVEHLRAARYGLHMKSVLASGRSGTVPVVWDSVDCISYLFEQAAARSSSRAGRLGARLELARTRRYEGRLVGQFDRVLVTSALDRDELRRCRLSVAVEQAPLGRGQRIAGAARGGRPAAGDREGATEDGRRRVDITVIPNGVDLDYFVPAGGPREPATVLFSGKMSYHANVTAALRLIEEIMPRVWAGRPDARLVIAGKDPAREILACHRQPEAQRDRHRA